MHFRVFVFYLICLACGLALSWRNESALLFVMIVYIAAHAMASLPDDLPLLGKHGSEDPAQEEHKNKQEMGLSP